MMVLTQVDAFGDDSDNNKNGEDLWWVALKAANGKADGEEGEDGDGDQMLKKCWINYNDYEHFVVLIISHWWRRRIKFEICIWIEKYDLSTNTITHSPLATAPILSTLASLHFLGFNNNGGCLRGRGANVLISVRLLSINSQRLITVHRIEPCNVHNHGIFWIIIQPNFRCFKLA